ncbi:MAG: AAA family ATPase [Neptuniibacter sp.]
MPRQNNRGMNPFKPHELPETFPEHYSEQNKEHCSQILEWLNEREHSLSWLAKLARLSQSTFYRSVKGEYKTDPTRFLKTALDAIDTQNARRGINHIPFVKTSVSEIAWTACHRARRYASFAVLAGFVGTGKTRSLVEYKSAHENTVLIEADPGMSVAALLDDLVKKIGCSFVKSSANQHSKFTAIIEELKGTDTLIIVDEAETITPKALHYLRRIRDKAGIGIVLSGTENLNGLIKREHGEFDQIRSRVNFWPNTVNGIKHEDAEAIIAIAFEDEGDIEQEIIEQFWRYSGGSMRMLVEDLIPAVRDYGLKKDHELSVDLIDSIANQVLNLKL